jgi:hypothetical protein
MGGWMDGWMGGWVDGWMDGWVDGWMGGWMDGWMGGWMGGWTDGWIDGWIMDAWPHSLLDLIGLQDMGLCPVVLTHSLRHLYPMVSVTHLFQDDLMTRS